MYDVYSMYVYSRVVIYTPRLSVYKIIIKIDYTTTKKGKNIHLKDVYCGIHKVVAIATSLNFSAEGVSPASCSCIMWMYFLDGPILPPLSYLDFLHSSNTTAPYGSPKQRRRTGSWALRKWSGRQTKALPDQTCSR